MSSRLVEQQLEEGLLLFGANRVDEAIARWHSVLVVCPDEPRAVDYLLSAGSDLARLALGDGDRDGVVSADAARPDDDVAPEDVVIDSSRDDEASGPGTNVVASGWLSHRPPSGTGSHGSAFEIAPMESSRGSATVAPGERSIPAHAPQPPSPAAGLPLDPTVRVRRLYTLQSVWPYLFIPVIVAAGTAVGYDVLRGTSRPRDPGPATPTIAATADVAGTLSADSTRRRPVQPARIAARGVAAGADPSADHPSEPGTQGRLESTGRFAVSLTAHPTSARIDLDGVEVGHGSLTRSLLRDGNSHVVRVSAPGYRAREFRFVDEAPLDAVSLERDVAQAIAGSAPLPPKTPRPNATPDPHEVPPRLVRPSRDKASDSGTVRSTDNIAPWTGP